MNANWKLYILFGAIAMSIGVAVGLSRSQEPAIAQQLPGAVQQSTEANSSGVTLTVPSAFFYAAGMDVIVDVRTSDSSVGNAWPVPAKAGIGGLYADSVAVSVTGRSVLQFRSLPPELSPGSTVTLRVTELAFYKSDGSLDTVEGSWALTLTTPGRIPEPGDVRALVPAEAMVGSSSFLVQGFQVGDALVIRYSLPSNVASNGGVTVSASGRPLESFRTTNAGSDVEMWFEAPSAHEIEITFQELIVSEGAANVAIELELADPHTSEPTETEPGVVEYGVDWSQAAGGPDVQWVKIVKAEWDAEASLLVRVAGTFSPAFGGPPAVLGDGRVLRVSGVGTYGATAVRGAETQLELQMPLEEMPEALRIDLSGAASAYQDVTASLRP